MPRSCSICTNLNRRNINRAIVRSESDGNIAKRFDLTKSAVYRHRINHVRPYLSELISEDPELSNIDPLAEIRALYYRAKRYLDAAEDSEDWPSIRAFHGEARKDLETLAKITGDLDNRGSDVDPQYLIQGVLAEVLNDYPQIADEVITRLESELAQP